VPDEVCVQFKDLGDYDYRPAREVAEGDENTEVCSLRRVSVNCMAILRQVDQSPKERQGGRKRRDSSARLV